MTNYLRGCLHKFEAFTRIAYYESVPQEQLRYKKITLELLSAYSFILKRKINESLPIFESIFLQNKKIFKSKFVIEAIAFWYYPFYGGHTFSA